MALALPGRVRVLAETVGRRAPRTGSSCAANSDATIGPLAPYQTPFGAWDRDALAAPDVEPGDLFGVGKSLGLLAHKFTTPIALGLLRLLDVPSRRTAPLARERIQQKLTELRMPDPNLVWEYLSAHPRPVEVSAVTHLPKPPGTTGRIFGETRVPGGPFASEPVQVTISRRAPDRPGALAHELATAVTGLAGRLDEPLPGLIPSYTGHIPLFQQYGPKRIEGQLLPSLLDRPEWVQVLDRQQALRAVQEWFAPTAAGIGR